MWKPDVDLPNHFLTWLFGSLPPNLTVLFRVASEPPGPTIYLWTHVSPLQPHVVFIWMPGKLKLSHHTCTVGILHPLALFYTPLPLFHYFPINLLIYFYYVCMHMMCVCVCMVGTAMMHTCKSEDSLVELLLSSYL